MHKSIGLLLTLAFVGTWLAWANAASQAAPTDPGPYAAAVAQLRATSHLLHQADHDYKGHRVKAIHEIHLAIHILHPVHKKHHAPTVKTAGGNLPQAVSDAHLKQAITQLQGVHAGLNNNAPAQAIAAIRAAVSQLNTALSIK